MVFSMSLGGCAVHPLPEDVTGNTTFHIVQKIRCETRDALIALTVRALRESQYPPTLVLADRIERREIGVTEIFDNPRLRRDVDPKVHTNFDIFGLSALAFDFTLVGVENNDASAAASFRYPFAEGVFNLGVGVGSNRERQNERKVKVGHTFLELYERTDAAVCEKLTAGTTGNLIYPIIGKIGMDELINTFYLLNRPYNPYLSPPVDKYGLPVAEAFRNKPEGGDIRDLTDTLQFITSFNGGATPTIELAPISSQVFRVASASANVALRRSDIHKVAISIVKGAHATSLAQARNLAGLRRVSAPGALGAKQRAWERLDELRTEDFFTRQREIARRLGLPLP
jgi:hypothetical protein